MADEGDRPRCDRHLPRPAGRVRHREAIGHTFAAVDPRGHRLVGEVGGRRAVHRQSSSWGDGIYKSNDGGRSWRNLGLRESHHIGRVALHPMNADVVYVAAMGHLWGPNEERGLYKTTDGGVT